MPWVRLWELHLMLLHSLLLFPNPHSIWMPRVFPGMDVYLHLYQNRVDSCSFIYSPFLPSNIRIHGRWQIKKIAFGSFSLSSALSKVNGAIRCLPNNIKRPIFDAGQLSVQNSVIAEMLFVFLPFHYYHFRSFLVPFTSFHFSICGQSWLSVWGF